jgi:L-threonylcarbamoyladenylate synthase
MSKNMSLEAVQAAALALKSGRLVAFPTETVYGLGADASNAEAVAKIYRAKGRPEDHPLIVHVSELDRVFQWAAHVPDYAIKLAKVFWPGPMTLILNRTPLAQDFITGGQETVGIRVPNHPIARELLSEFERIGGKGVAAPSANRFGKVSPTTFAGVFQELQNYLDPEDLIIDGGQSEVGIESTIVDCTGEAPKILRLGAITPSMISNVSGLILRQDDSNIRVSGLLASHYAPNAELVLNQPASPGEGLIALSTHQTPLGVTRLAAPATTTDYANQLYLALRNADDLGLTRVVAITPEGDEIAQAITDRLQKASHRTAESS